MNALSASESLRAAGKQAPLEAPDPRPAQILVAATEIELPARGGPKSRPNRMGRELTNEKRQPRRRVSIHDFWRYWVRSREPPSNMIREAELISVRRALPVTPFATEYRSCFRMRRGGWFECREYRHLARYLNSKPFANPGLCALLIGAVPAALNEICANDDVVQKFRRFAAVVLAVAPTPALCADSSISAADTGFMDAATALVLMMTVPGLALFYAGMVRKKNVLRHHGAELCGNRADPVPGAAGYSLAFQRSGPWLGDLGRVFFQGIGIDTISPFAKTIP